MPRVSKKLISKDVLQELEDNFAFLISSLSSGKDIQNFFETFLTKEEKTMLTKRLMLHLMVENHYDPTQIARVLSLTRETVYTHTLILHIGGQIYKKIIAKIAQRQKTKEFWRLVEKVLHPLDIIINSKTNMKARAKLASGDFS